jgi:hypothetical protein
MTILGLIIVLLVLVIAIYVAKQMPVPFSYILYAVILVVAIVVLLQVTGIMTGSSVLNRRLN